MTTELEKQFFDTFGIEPKYYCSYHDCNCPIEDIGKFNKKCPKQAVTKECDARSKQVIYPKITDEHYLELICVIYKAKNSLNSEIDIFELNVEKLKITVLERLIWINKTYKNNKLKHQVQAIFEGER